MKNNSLREFQEQDQINVLLGNHRGSGVSGLDTEQKTEKKKDFTFELFNDLDAHEQDHTSSFVSEEFCIPEEPLEINLPHSTQLKGKSSKKVVIEIIGTRAKTQDEENSENALDELFKIHSLGDFPSDMFEVILTFVGETWFRNCLDAVPGWKPRIMSDFVWRDICERTFKPPAYIPLQIENQAPKRFGSWRMAGLKRPRVKRDGVYIHRHTYIRDRGPENMWWGAGSEKFLEISHYRYVTFFDDGRLIYASTPIQPAVMLSHLRTVYLKKEITTMADRIYWGEYKVTGKVLLMLINLGDYSVKFSFDIESVNIISATKHESLIHPRKKRLCSKSNARGTIEYPEAPLLTSPWNISLPESRVIEHPLTGLYSFDRKWHFHAY